MTVAFVGWGVETQSAYRFLGELHDYTIVSEEQRDDFPNVDNVKIHNLYEKRAPGLTGNVTDLSYMEGLDDFELIVLTPSARKNLEKVYAADNPLWKKTKTTVEIFFENCKSKNIIGITGTKGKGTTTTLITKFLEANNTTVHVGGNIGIPMLDLLASIKPDDWVVLELSSFQLYKLGYSPHIAVHLMMIPEHIEEWHKTMDDYVSSKRNIFAHQKAEDFAIFNPLNNYAVDNVASSAGIHIPYLKHPGAYTKDNSIYIDDTQIIPIDQVAILGKHNIENICAAITATWRIHQNIDAYREVIGSFTGLEHRLQLVRTLNEVSYYDDSFGTTPDTAIVAMDAFDSPKIMIVGGHDKGNDFTTMIERLKGDDIRAIICLGPTGSLIAKKLLDYGISADSIVVKDDANNWNIEEIVKVATNMATPGDVVLLSTGSASFGIFKDYKERGNQFITEVNRL